MAINVETLSAAKGYVDETLQGQGALQGPKGDKGDPGEQGPEGPQGDKGNTGAQGVSIIGVKQEDGRLKCVLSDGTEVDAGILVLDVDNVSGILSTANGGTGKNYAEFYEFIQDLLYNADGIIYEVGIGNEKSRNEGSKSQFAFWKTNNNTRIECVTSKSGNYLMDSITIYTELSGGGAFPALIIDYNVTPGLDNEGDLGSSNKRWCNIYSATGTISTSDRNKKKDIVELDADKIIDFIMGLNPVSYKFIDGQSGRTHHGLIAQDVEELLKKLGMTSLDFAGFIKSPKIEEVEVITQREVVDKEGNVTLEDVVIIEKRVVENEFEYGLRYEELIADLITVVQHQKNEIEDLKERMTKTEEMYAELCGKIQ